MGWAIAGQSWLFLDPLRGLGGAFGFVGYICVGCCGDLLCVQV
jgi:hypothetical protein